MKKMILMFLFLSMNVAIYSLDIEGEYKLVGIVSSPENRSWDNSTDLYTDVTSLSDVKIKIIKVEPVEDFHLYSFSMFQLSSNNKEVLQFKYITLLENDDLYQIQPRHDFILDRRSPRDNHFLFSFKDNYLYVTSLSEFQKSKIHIYRKS